MRELRYTLDVFIVYCFVEEELKFTNVQFSLKFEGKFGRNVTG